MGEGTYAVAAGVLLGALQLIPELGYLLGFVVLLIPLAIAGPGAAIAFALIYIGSVKAGSILLEGRLSRGVLDVHPGLLIPAIVVLSQFGLIWLFAAAPFIAIVRDLARYANARLADPPGPAGVLPGERVQGARAGRAAPAIPSVYRAPAPPTPAAAPALVAASVAATQAGASRPTAAPQRRPIPAVYANITVGTGARPTTIIQRSTRP